MKRKITPISVLLRSGPDDLKKRSNAKDFVYRNFYVANGWTSVPTEEEAVHILKRTKKCFGSIQHKTPRASIKNILPKILRIWISEGNPFPFRKVLVYVGTLFLSVLSSRWPREDCCLYDSLGFVSNHHCTWKGRGHHWIEGYHDSLPWPLSAFREKASSKTSPDWKISKRSKRVCTNWPLSLIKKVSK